MQSEIDFKNSQFWDELCGSALARSIGITEVTPESLKRFDQAYMDFYPYLPSYVTREKLQDKKVLEIGLGFGTLGQLIFSQRCDYYGLDIAEGPVSMMAFRLSILGHIDTNHVRLGSALEIPFDDASFDFVYSIGCLHHTGNLLQSISEVYRVLRPGGKAVIMLYNRHSFRQLVHVPNYRLRKWFTGTITRNISELKRSLYDQNSKGEAAPYTDYVSRKEVRHLFRNFTSLRIDSHNFDSYSFLPIRRIKFHQTQPSIPLNRLLRAALYSDTSKAIGNNADGLSTKNACRNIMRSAIKLYRYIIAFRHKLQLVSSPLIAIPREKLLNNLGRIVGLDLYIVAQK
jgi:SAM-dependent methyltransferase